MINHFTFHAVGQGLFYSGCLNDGEYNFVYDCGAKPRTVNFQNEIKNYTQRHKVIDFVLLSHLHEDHFAGITDLCQNSYVKKLYLPYLGDDKDVVALILANTLLTGNAWTPTSLNVFNAVAYLYGLTDVAENGQRLRETKVEFWGKSDKDISKKDRYGYIYESQIFTYSVDGAPYWEFKLLNRAMGVGLLYNLSTSLQSLLTNYASVFNHPVSVLELIQMGQIDVIKQLYDNVFAKINLNLTSSLLIHYPTRIAQSSINSCQPCCSQHFRMRIRLPGYCTTTVLTGDVEFDTILSDEVNKTICMLPDCVLQIPHHGALPNWNTIDKHLLMHSDVFVISHGYNHKYHPNGTAVLQMHKYLCSKYIRSVTQNQDYNYAIWC